MGETSQGLTYPTYENIVDLNIRQIQRTGGNLDGAGKFHNENSLLWVLDAIQHPLYYPTISQKAAALAWTIINGHVFIDGNKRTGISALMIFLRLNGFRLAGTDAEIMRVAIQVANAHGENYTREQFAEWVKKHLMFILPPT